jgi:hypothetical protein
VRKMRAPMGAASGLQRGTEGMPEVQKPVLEHAAPKANQNQGLDSRLASESEEAAALMQIPGEYSSRFRQRARQALEAVNTLSLALTDHNHQWTKRERWLYSRASGWLISFCGAGSGEVS